MAIETFTYKRQSGATGTIDYRVREVQFGDGYTQVTADGLNNKVQVWQMSFVGNMVVIQPIIDFFDRHVGYKAFYWTPPGTATPCLFRVVRPVLTSNGAGVYTIAAEFKQVFKP